MAFDAFLKIDKIPGEATDEMHKDWIEVLSFSWGETNPGSVLAPGNRPAERAQFQDFSVAKHLDKASPLLYLFCAGGEHIPSATLRLQRAVGDKPVEYMEYKLTDLLVSGVQAGGQAGGEAGRPTESISLNFGKIEWKYTQVRAAGQAGGTVASFWDRFKNAGGLSAG